MRANYNSVTIRGGVLPVSPRKEARRWVKLLASEQTSERRSEAV